MQRIRKSQRKRGKIIITKPFKTSTAMVTRRSRKKDDKEGGDIIFRKPSPTFQDKLKELEAGASIKNFKALKCENRIDDDHKKIEDMVMDKMVTWKNSPDQLTSQFPNVLMEKIKSRWEFSMQTMKDIYGKTLRQILLSIADREIIESLTKNEEKLTLKFNTCLVLMKDIDHVVRNATKRISIFFIK